MNIIIYYYLPYIFFKCRKRPKAKKVKFEPKQHCSFEDCPHIVNDAQITQHGAAKTKMRVSSKIRSAHLPDIKKYKVHGTIVNLLGYGLKNIRQILKTAHTKIKSQGNHLKPFKLNSKVKMCHLLTAPSIVF